MTDRIQFQRIVQGTYLLGILFALGRYVDRSQAGEEGYFLLSHHRMHFLWTLQSAFGLRSSLYTVTRSGGQQYRLKVFGPEREELIQLGWDPSDGEMESYPNIPSGHRHFIRAYTEIRSVLVNFPAGGRKRHRAQGPGLRIYGNNAFLRQLLRYMPHSATGISRELPTEENNGQEDGEGCLGLYRVRDLRILFDYLYREPVKYFDAHFREEMRKAIDQGETIQGRR